MKAFFPDATLPDADCKSRPKIALVMGWCGVGRLLQVTAFANPGCNTQNDS
jgi:hypothetical protein